MRAVQCLRPSTPLPSTSKILYPFNLERHILTNVSPSPNDNQSVKRKHNSRMTIMYYQVLLSGQLSFSVATH